MQQTPTASRDGFTFFHDHIQHLEALLWSIQSVVFVTFWPLRTLVSCEHPTENCGC